MHDQAIVYIFLQVTAMAHGSIHHIFLRRVLEKRAGSRAAAAAAAAMGSEKFHRSLEQPSLSISLSDDPWPVNRRRPGSLYSIIEYNKSSSS
jgi:hypothetical protein